MNNVNIFNKKLLYNIVRNLIAENKDNFNKQFYLNKIPDSFNYKNKTSAHSQDSYNLDDIFSKEGVLSKNITNYEFRNNQFDFAKDCLKNINNSSILIAEAETGIGKSFSYLASAIISGNKNS